MFIPFGRQHVKNRYIGEIKTPSVGYYDRPELYADEFLSKKTTDLSLDDSDKTNVRIVGIVLLGISYMKNLRDEHLLFINFFGMFETTLFLD